MSKTDELYPHKLVVLVVTTVASFMSAFDGNVVSLALPKIAESLAMPLAYVIWIPTSYLLVSASLQMGFGKIADSWGRRKIFIIGLSLFTLGSALSGAATDGLLLILFRVLQGVGAAVMSAVTSAIAVANFPQSERGRVLGITTGGVYFGATMGPIIGGLMVQTIGWRSIFYVNVPIGILSVIAVILYLPRDNPVPMKARFDIAGAAALSAFMITGIVALSGGDLAFSLSETILFVALSLVSFFSFVLIERRSAAPLMDLRLFTHNKRFAAGNATALCNYATAQGTTVLLSLYLQLVLLYPPASAAVVLLAQPVMMVIMSPIAGTLADRIDARVLSSLGMLSRSTGLFWLSFLGLSSPIQDVWMPLLLVGFGHGLFSSPNASSIMGSVTPDKLGLASGTLGTVRTAAGTLGIVVMSSIVAAAMPPGAFTQVSGGAALSGGLEQLFVSGIKGAFLFGAVFSGIGVITSLIRGGEERESVRTAKGAH